MGVARRRPERTSTMKTISPYLLRPIRSLGQAQRDRCARLAIIDAEMLAARRVLESTRPTGDGA